MGEDARRLTALTNKGQGEAAIKLLGRAPCSSARGKNRTRHLHGVLNLPAIGHCSFILERLSSNLRLVAFIVLHVSLDLENASPILET